MDPLKFSNRCVYRDNETGHIYRLNKTSASKTQVEYYVCWMKHCNAKVKISEGQKQTYGDDHTHSDKLAKHEYKNIQFDKCLGELLDTIDIRDLCSDEIYEMAVKNIRNARFSKEHKKKKMKLINTHRCFAKKYKPSGHDDSTIGQKPESGEYNKENKVCVWADIIFYLYRIGRWADELNHLLILIHCCPIQFSADHKANVRQTRSASKAGATDAADQHIDDYSRDSLDTEAAKPIVADGRLNNSMHSVLITRRRNGREDSFDPFLCI